jgi:hypothetical protein
MSMMDEDSRPAASGGTTQFGGDSGGGGGEDYDGECGVMHADFALKQNLGFTVRVAFSLLSFLVHADSALK